MFRLQRGHEDESKLTLTGEGMTEFGEVKVGGLGCVSSCFPSLTTLGVGGSQSPLAVTKVHSPLFLSVWGLYLKRTNRKQASVRYALAINWFSQYALNSYFCLFFFKQKEKKV